jgi:hypothetical protein
MCRTRGLQMRRVANSETKQSHTCKSGDCFLAVAAGAPVRCAVLVKVTSKILSELSVWKPRFTVELGGPAAWAQYLND